jgi:hypothetical protein
MRRPAFLAVILAAAAFVAAAGCGDDPAAAPTAAPAAPPTASPHPATSAGAAPAGTAYGGRADLCAGESYRDLPLDVYLDCPVTPRDLPGVGTRAGGPRPTTRSSR